MAELAAYLHQGPPPLDYITLAGSGEPTLNLGLGRIIRHIKALTGTPVAVLTNGALLYLPEVRDELQAADLVLPSLDAAREESFRAINRPLPDYPLSRLIEGLEAFRREYAGQIWLEILLLQGLNDSEADLEALRRALQPLAPDKVQLNTAVRPGVEDYARALNSGRDGRHRRLPGGRGRSRGDRLLQRRAPSRRRPVMTPSWWRCWPGGP